MPPILEISGVIKDYRALRPLRIRDLVLSAGEVVAISGLDQAAAEVLTNLLTGATVPDEGSIRVFGEETRAIENADAWLAGLERFGIVSDRVALLDGLTVRQNIALAMTLDLDPLIDEVAEAVRLLGSETGLTAPALETLAGEAPATVRLRARVARALAPNPRLLLFEHPTGSLARAEVGEFGRDLFALVRARAVSALIVSADRDFTRPADRQLALDPATGILKHHGLRAWFR